MEREKVDHRETHHQTSYHEGIRNIEESENGDVWEGVSKLLERKSHHVYSDYDVPTRIELTKLSGKYTTTSLAKYSGIEPSTAIKMVKETTAAATYLLGEENDCLPFSQLDEYGKEQFKRFEQLENERKKVGDVLRIDGVSEILDKNHALNLIFQRQCEDGAISPLLEELQIDPPVNINHYTKKFLEQGDPRGGSLVLMRRVLYRDWIENGASVHNAANGNIMNAISAIAKRAYTQQFVLKEKPRSPLRIRERNISHFLSYLVQKDFEKWVNNYSISDDAFDSKFNLFKTSFDNHRGVNFSLNTSHLSHLSRRRLAGFIEDDMLNMSINPVAYYVSMKDGLVLDSLINFADAVSGDNWRAPHVKDIAQTRYVGDQTARKIYDAGIGLVDHLLLTNGAYIRDFRENDLKSPLSRDFKDYVGLVKGSK